MYVNSLAAVIFVFSATSALAGSCAPDITATQASFDAKLHATAAAGPVAVEATSATLHHQPTPTSVARAEENLGTLSQSQTASFDSAMTRARAADAAGDAKVCEAALDEARERLAD